MSNKNYCDAELPDGTVIGKAATSLVGLYGGTPTAQLAYQAATTDTTIVAQWNLVRAWWIANGTMAAA